MVLTRRSTGNGAPIPTTKSKLCGEGEDTDNDTIHVQRPHSRRSKFFAITPMPPTTRPSATPSSTGGMEDISLTSPSTHEVLSPNAIGTPKRNRDDIPEAHPDRTLSSALRRLAPMPGTTGKGSVHNPIILEEYSPRRQPPPPLQRWHYKKKSHAYHAPRAALAPIPVKGNTTFTGHKSHDIYRMMNAKLAAEGWKTSVVPLPPQRTGPSKGIDYKVPFEVQYPLSAQYSAKPKDARGFADHCTGMYAQYHSKMGVSLSGDSEATLRRKAIQMVQEFLRSHPITKPPSHDFDETSASETEASISAPKVPSIRLTSPHFDNPASNAALLPKRRKFDVLRDPTDHVTPLIAQTNLLTSLLQVYPSSKDQQGLREDIGMLISVQNQQIATWMDSENQRSRKRRTSNNDSAVSVGCDRKDEEKESEAVRLEKKRRLEDDADVRALMSAAAGMWGAGSVVDVFSAAEDVDEQVHGCEVGLNEGHGKGVCGWEKV